MSVRLVPSRCPEAGHRGGQARCASVHIKWNLHEVRGAGPTRISCACKCYLPRLRYGAGHPLTAILEWASVAVLSSWQKGHFPRHAGAGRVGSGPSRRESSEGWWETWFNVRDREWARAGAPGPAYHKMHGVVFGRGIWSTGAQRGRWVRSGAVGFERRSMGARDRTMPGI
jgi:hypothetical protein